jgi:uncharacterized protein YycO
MICVKVRGYTGTGFGSGFIQWWTRSPISHVSLVFHMGHTVEEVEAIQGAGVVRHTPHSKDDKVFKEWDVPLSYEQVLEAHTLACSLVGSKYDWQAIRAFVVHRRSHNAYKWMCSELVAYVLWKVGYRLSRRKPFMETPPTICESYRLSD